MQLDTLSPGSQDRLLIDTAAGVMEVFIDVPARTTGLAVIGHPQPLLGGSARHKIPQLLARSLQEAGWLALRPNFRGVGASAGLHDEGRGEADDVTWLVAQARSVHPVLPIALVGFSFGAFVMAQVAHRLAVEQKPAVAVALAGAPVGTVEAGRHYDPPPLAPHTLMVHGERDEQVRLQSVLDWCGPQNQAVMVVPGADHFFSGRLPLLRSLVVAHLQACRAQAHA